MNFFERLIIGAATFVWAYVIVLLVALSACSGGTPSAVATPSPTIVKAPTPAAPTPAAPTPAAPTPAAPTPAAPTPAAPTPAAPTPAAPTPAAPTPAAPTPAVSAKAACFAVIDATLYIGKPDMSALGVKTIVTTNPSQWWDTAPSGMSQQDIVLMHANDSGAAPVVFDMEIAATDPLYGNLLAWMREGGSTAPLAYYSELPVRDYWDAISGPASAGYKAWQTLNNTLQPMVTLVSDLYPSLYTFYDDQDGWVTYAKANIAEARRIGNGKSVYPFIWPQYHNSAPADIALTFMDVAFWQLQLQTVYDDADGVVIWGGWDYVNDKPAQWDDSAPWWQATKAFIATIPNLCTP